MIEKTNKCNNCGKEFEWYYLVPTEVGTGLKAHWIPKDKEPVRDVIGSIKKAGKKIPTKVLADCPNCKKSNKIIVEINQL